MARPLIPRVIKSTSSANPNTMNQLAHCQVMFKKVMHQHKHLKKKPPQPLPPNAASKSESTAVYLIATKPKTISGYVSEVKPSTSSALQPKSTSKSIQIQVSKAPGSSENSKKRTIFDITRSSLKKIPQGLKYPRPSAPHNYKHLYIGENETLVPWEYYINIPWYSYELSTRYLTEFIFEKEVLATHNLHGKKQLDRLIVEDIVTHVSQRCSVGEEHVVFTIAKICADFSKLYKAGLLKDVKPPESD